MFPPLQLRRGDRRLHHRRERSRRTPSGGGMGGFYVAITFSPTGRPLRGGHRRTCSAASRSSSTTSSTRRRSSRPRSAAAAPASRWRRRSLRSSSGRQEARDRLPPARSRADHAVERVAHRPDPRRRAIKKARLARHRRRPRARRSWSCTTGKAGFVADGAVLFNPVLQMAILARSAAPSRCWHRGLASPSVWRSTPTCSSTTMRIREELRAGCSVRAVVEAGYDKAFSSIRRPRHRLHLRSHPRAVRHRPGRRLRRHPSSSGSSRACTPVYSAHAWSSTGGTAGPS